MKTRWYKHPNGSLVYVGHPMKAGAGAHMVRLTHRLPDGSEATGVEWLSRVEKMGLIATKGIETRALMRRWHDAHIMRRVRENPEKKIA